jgi:hypothetical protein
VNQGLPVAERPNTGREELPERVQISARNRRKTALVKRRHLVSVPLWNRIRDGVGDVPRCWSRTKPHIHTFPAAATHQGQTPANFGRNYLTGAAAYLAQSKSWAEARTRCAQRKLLKMKAQNRLSCALHSPAMCVRGAHDGGRLSPVAGAIRTEELTNSFGDDLQRIGLK